MNPFFNRSSRREEAPFESPAPNSSQVAMSSRVKDVTNCDSLPAPARRPLRSQIVTLNNSTHENYEAKEAH
jgi:hypothetical protein